MRGKLIMIKNPANAIKDSTSFSLPRSLDNLPAFLEAQVENPKSLEGAPKENGSPHTIIIAGAGLRAADLVRYVVSHPVSGPL